MPFTTTTDRQINGDTTDEDDGLMTSCCKSHDEISQKERIIRWKEIINHTEISDYKELDKALRTSIGAYKMDFQRKDLLKIRNQYTTQNKIDHPFEGYLDYHTLASLYDLLKEACITNLEVEDEFHEKRKHLT